MTEDKTMQIFAIIGLCMVLALSPFAFIWSLNTLFNTNIPYTFYTWLATLIFVITIGHKTGKES